MPIYFAPNIKFLRKRRRRTQEELAGILGIKRSTLNNYENGISGPNMQALLALSDYFQLAVDTLLRVDLSKLRESQLFELEHGQDVFLKGSNIRVLATTVDSNNAENIELVSDKAKAGYLNGFSDPEYIAELPVFQLPFLSHEKKYRTFQINGDSMLPIPDGAWVIGEFVQDWTQVRSGERCVVLTLNEGLVFKKVNNLLDEASSLEMISTNPEYQPYRLPANEICEIWRFVHFIANEIPEQTLPDQLFKQMELIREELTSIKGKLT